MIQTPIETPSILKGASTIYLIPSITAVNDFGGTGEFKVKLIYKDTQIADIKSTEFPIEIFSDKKPGICFEVTMAEPPQVGGVLHKESYGLHHPLFLKSENENIAVEKNSAFDFSTRFPYKPQILKGRFSQANLIVPSEYKNSYNRFILKIDDDKFLGPLDIIERTGSHLYDHERFNVHPSLMGMSFRTGGGYSEVNLENKRYRFYEVADSIYLIDGIEREDLGIFKQRAEIIRISLAILCGKFYGGECSYVTSDDPSFKNIEGIWYEMERNTVLSNRRIINLEFFRQTFEKNEDDRKKYKPIDKPLDTAVFSSLCTVLLNNEDLLHAAELVISAMGNSDPVQQGALYSVALETLTATLGNVPGKDLRPVQDKTVLQNLTKDLKDALGKHSADLSSEGFTILTSKINSINTPANQDKLTKTFELYDIDLTDSDKAAIKNRNNYLHGRSPLDRKLQFELSQISLRLHTLIVALLLKYVGYSGHVINLDASVYTNNEENTFELISKQKEKIETSLAAMQNASDNNNEKKFNKAKEELAQFIDDNPLPQIIRVI